jgi:hypothetical protein
MKTWPFYLAGIGVAILFGVAATSLVMRSCSAPRPLAHSSARDSIRTSNAVSRALDSAALVEYGRKVEAARGDSLAGLLSAQAARIRTRWLPGRLDTLIQRDTVRDSVLVSGSDIRTILVADSSCVVRSDSLSGELVQAQFDADQCAEELRKRPSTCHGWSAFGIGFGVGSAATAGACMLFH